MRINVKLFQIELGKVGLEKVVKAVDHIRQGQDYKQLFYKKKLARDFTWNSLCKIYVLLLQHRNRETRM
jgi:hypothetical protein